MDANTLSGDGLVGPVVENTQQQESTSTSTDLQITEATDQAISSDSSASTGNAVAPESSRQEQAELPEQQPEQQSEPQLEQPEPQPPSQDPEQGPTPETPPPSSDPPAQAPELEHAYWAEFEEDTSEPSESEMKEIEAAADKDYDTYDYDHWEKSVFTDLNDPEYRPVEKARLTWKIKGVRGTKGCPNRAKLMCSPSAYVGGYWWRIKFFPRGNKVHFLSVYLECSSTMPSPDSALPESEFKVHRGDPGAVLKDHSPDVDIKYNKTEDSKAWLENYKSQYPAAQQEYAQKDAWTVAAQIGAIIYNPEEGRTGYMRVSSHQFNPHSSDWGWTNFHGPWDEIHRRQHGERRALLCNDTIAIDAYIRVIDDPTRFLWWHSCEKQPTWDSLNLTGYRPLGDSASNHSADVAGLACWLHITPFSEIIKSVNILEHYTNSDVKPRPLCEALQKVLWQLHSRDESLHEVDTRCVTSTLRNMHEYSGDVSEFWERLRRTLELELAGTEAGTKFAELFDSPTLPVLGVIGNTLPPDFNSRICVPADQTRTIREGLGRYFSTKPGPWSLPPVLHVEINRQKLDHAAHQWKLLYNRVDLDEQLDLAPWVLNEQCGKYVLYGYVVHRGRRTSNKFFSIIRPGGPGTRWLAFDDGSDNLVESLTHKTALGPHLGIGPSETPDHKKGHDAAVSVLYIRSDVVGDYLTGPKGPWDVPTLLNQYLESNTYSPTEHAADKAESENIHVEVHSVSQYDKMGSLFDSFDLMSQAKSSGNVIYLTVPRSWTFVELRKQIAKCKSTATELISPECVRLWHIGHYRELYGAVLAINRVSKLNDTLDLRLSVVRFWLEVVSGEDAKDFAMSDPPKKIASENKPEETVRERQGSESSDDQRPIPEAEEQQSSTTPIDLNTAEAERFASEISTDNTNSPAATPSSSSSDTSLSADPNGDNSGTADAADGSQGIGSTTPSQAQHEPSSVLPPNAEEQQNSQQGQQVSIETPATEPPVQSTGTAPVSLLLVQEPPNETPPRPDNEGSESSSSSSSSSSGDEDEVEPEPEPEIQLCVKHTYYFVQIFDTEKQVLRTVGSFFAHADDNIKSALRKRLEWPDQKDFDIWIRLDKTMVKTVTSQTFAKMEDGVCFIVGDRLTRAKRSELHQAGNFTVPGRLVEYLWALSRQHPTRSFTGMKTIEATFASDYYSGDFHKGFYHGHGKHISDMAAIYEGDFVFGHRQGKGSIEYPSGDTYNGDWLEDKQHGQGIYVERKTGNKYVGGYKDGRRHGKGTTYWEVADEELDLCQICYGEEQDALFFDCGHVCACVECASQVDICPICRKNVIRVVKIYRS